MQGYTTVKRKAEMREVGFVKKKKTGGLGGERMAAWTVGERLHLRVREVRHHGRRRKLRGRRKESHYWVLGARWERSSKKKNLRARKGKKNKV